MANYVIKAASITISKLDYKPEYEDEDQEVTPVDVPAYNEPYSISGFAKDTPGGYTDATYSSAEFNTSNPVQAKTEDEEYIDIDLEIYKIKYKIVNNKLYLEALINASDSEDYWNFEEDGALDFSDNPIIIKIENLKVPNYYMLPYFINNENVEDRYSSTFEYNGYKYNDINGDSTFSDKLLNYKGVDNNHFRNSLFFVRDSNYRPWHGSNCESLKNKGFKLADGTDPKAILRGCMPRNFMLTMSLDFPYKPITSGNAIRLDVGDNKIPIFEGPDFNSTQNVYMLSIKWLDTTDDITGQSVSGLYVKYDWSGDSWHNTPLYYFFHHEKHKITYNGIQIDSTVSFEDLGYTPTVFTLVVAAAGGKGGISSSPNGGGGGGGGAYGIFIVDIKNLSDKVLTIALGKVNTAKTYMSCDGDMLYQLNQGENANGIKGGAGGSFTKETLANAPIYKANIFCVISGNGAKGGTHQAGDGRVSEQSIWLGPPSTTQSTTMTVIPGWAGGRTGNTAQDRNATGGGGAGIYGAAASIESAYSEYGRGASFNPQDVDRTAKDGNYGQGGGGGISFAGSSPLQPGNGGKAFCHILY